MRIKKYLGLTGLVTALNACGTEKNNTTTTNLPNNTPQNYKPDTGNTTSPHNITTTPKTDSGTTPNNNNHIDAGQEDSGTEYIPQPDASTTETPDAGNTTNYSPTLEMGMTELITSPRKNLHIKIFGTDQDRDTLEYKFEYGDGTTTEWNENNEITHQYERTGIYDLIAYARDNNGGETNTRLEIKVQDGETNNPPVARLKCTTDTTDDLADCHVNEDGIKIYTMRVWEEGCIDLSESYDPDNDAITECRFYPNVTERPDRYVYNNAEVPLKSCPLYNRTGNFNVFVAILDNKSSEGRTSTFKAEVSE